MTSASWSRRRPRRGDRRSSTTPSPAASRPVACRSSRPVSSGDVLWSELADDDPELADWCSERWLGALPASSPPPAELRRHARRAAPPREHVISPTRQRANGEVTLRWTRGGFGTPFFGDDVQLRVEGDVFIVQQAGEGRSGASPVSRTPRSTSATTSPASTSRWPTSRPRCRSRRRALARRLLRLRVLRARAAARRGRPRAPGELRQPLARALRRRARARARRPAASAPATASPPGDAAHPEPYVYVAPWTARPEGALWQAESFPGAELGLAELLDAPDQREAALAFLRERLDALTAGAVS